MIGLITLQARSIARLSGRIRFRIRAQSPGVIGIKKRILAACSIDLVAVTPSNAACTEILLAEQMPSLLWSCQNYAEKKKTMNLLCCAGASDGQVHLIQKDLQSIKSQTFRLVHPSMTLDSRAPELGRILLRLCLRFWCFRLLSLCFLLIQNKVLSLSTRYTFFLPIHICPCIVLDIVMWR